MTDIEILEWAALANYAYLHIDRSCTIGPGQESWELQLPTLTTLQRATLITKLERWKAMLDRERAVAS
jgi:hypothetical protein